MLTMNHTVAYLLAILRLFKDVQTAESYVEEHIPELLLPDAIRMYGPRCVFHCTESSVNKDATSYVVLAHKPNDLKAIKYNFVAFEQPMKKCVIDELSHPEVFIEHNSCWAKSAYVTHLYQDCTWDNWVRNKVDVSSRFDNKFVYYSTYKVVDGDTLRKDLSPMDNILFQKLTQMIYSEFGVKVDVQWFKTHVFDKLYDAYDAELAENTIKYIKLPDPNMKFELPEFVLGDKDVEAIAEEVVEKTVLFV